jgi:hypothetical protein
MSVPYCSELPVLSSGPETPPTILDSSLFRTENPVRELRSGLSIHETNFPAHVVSRAVTDTCYPTMRRCKDLVFSDTWGGGGSGKSKVLATMATFLARAGFHVLATAPAYTTTDRLLETIKAPG